MGGYLPRLASVHNPKHECPNFRALPDPRGHSRPFRPPFLKLQRHSLRPQAAPWRPNRRLRHRLARPFEARNRRPRRCQRTNRPKGQLVPPRFSDGGWSQKPHVRRHQHDPEQERGRRTPRGPAPCRVGVELCHDALY